MGNINDMRQDMRQGVLVSTRSRAMVVAPDLANTASDSARREHSH